MIVGIVSYGYIIATVAASLANADSGRARYQEKLKAIQKYLQVFWLITFMGTHVHVHVFAGSKHGCFYTTQSY